MPEPIDTAELKVRPEVARFALLMEQRLRENEEKGGWRRCPRSELTELLIKEIGELAGAVVQSAITPAEPRLEWAVRRKAANVGNFAMMIADNFGRLDKVDPPPQP